MQAVTIYLAIISYVCMISTTYVGFRHFKKRVKRNSNLSMLAILTLALTTFHTVTVLYITFSY